MKFTYREYMFHILNGISMGVIVALIPSALLGQLMQALSGIWPGFSSSILTITTFNMSLLPAMAAFSVGIAPLLYRLAVVGGMCQHICKPVRPRLCDGAAETVEE